MDLGKEARVALNHAAHNDKLGWMFSTGRVVRKRAVAVLMKHGLAEDGGLATMVDGDGWTIEPEREKWCYQLTDAGRAEDARYSAECRARYASMDVSP